MQASRIDGAYLEAERVRRDMRVAAWTRVLNVTPVTYRKWVQGHALSRRSQRLVAAILGVDDDLVSACAVCGTTTSGYCITRNGSQRDEPPPDCPRYTKVGGVIVPREVADGQPD